MGDEAPSRGTKLGDEAPSRGTKLADEAPSRASAGMCFTPLKESTRTPIARPRCLENLFRHILVNNYVFEKSEEVGN